MYIYIQRERERERERERWVQVTPGGNSCKVTPGVTLVKLHIFYTVNSWWSYIKSISNPPNPI